MNSEITEKFSYPVLKNKENIIFSDEARQYINRFSYRFVYSLLSLRDKNELILSVDGLKKYFHKKYGRVSKKMLDFADEESKKDKYPLIYKNPEVGPYITGLFYYFISVFKSSSEIEFVIKAKNGNLNVVKSKKVISLEEIQDTIRENVLLYDLFKTVKKNSP